MSGPDRPAEKIRRLVAMAGSNSTAEAPIARKKARDAIAALDTELLDTLARRADDSAVRASVPPSKTRVNWCRER